jgi:SnoaL-like protein
MSDTANGVDRDGRESPTVTYSRRIDHPQFTQRDGSKHDLVVRVTDVYRKIHGEWLIVQEHLSVPMDLATGKLPATAVLSMARETRTCTGTVSRTCGSREAALLAWCPELSASGPIPIGGRA